MGPKPFDTKGDEWERSLDFSGTPLFNPRENTEALRVGVDIEAANMFEYEARFEGRILSSPATKLTIEDCVGENPAPFHSNTVSHVPDESPCCATTNSGMSS